jgi:hypothetical protein
MGRGRAFSYATMAGGEWDQAYEYFQRAWNRVVLPRLKYRFAVGPIDWQHPPDLDGAAER